MKSHMYSIRDRLLNFYMRPFTAPTDQEAQAAIAFNINSEEIRDAVTQAPHHFELWKIATIEENGDVVPAKEFLCECSSLIRTRVREGLAGGERTQRPTDPNERGSGSAPRAQGAENRPVPDSAQG